VGDGIAIEFTHGVYAMTFEIVNDDNGGTTSLPDPPNSGSANVKMQWKICLNCILPPVRPPIELTVMPSPCEGKYKYITVAEARSNTLRICTLIGDWSVVEVGRPGGSGIGGAGYGCAYSATICQSPCSLAVCKGGNNSASAYRCTDNECVEANEGGSGLALAECLNVCGPEKLDRFRCVNNTCIASFVGATDESTCAETCGPASGRCAAALTQACGPARRIGSAGNCFVCCGTHQHALHNAGCKEPDFDKFCHSRGPVSMLQQASAAHAELSTMKTEDGFGSGDGGGGNNDGGGSV
jgi:hypothetical protein